ncbi:MAG: TIR domain-containing protein [Crocinitomicaceae bacterium]
MAKKVNVFISFRKEDIKIVKKFERMFVDHYECVTSSYVREDKIPNDLNDEATLQLIIKNHIQNSSITIVIIGENTYKSNFVDWEIKASLRGKKNDRKRSGLIGIFVPEITNGGKKHKNLIPERLGDNIKDGYAHCYDWTDDKTEFMMWIDQALFNRKNKQPNNNRLMKGR